VKLFYKFKYLSQILQLAGFLTLLLFAASISLAEDVYKLAAKEFKNKNYKKVIDLFYPLCKKGDKVACGNIGIAYEYANDTCKAISFYKKSCNMGFGEACYRLGELYRTKGKFNRSLIFHEKACNYNKFESCYIAASLIIYNNEKKKVGKSDIKKALKMFKKACNNKIYDACLEEGILYMKKGEDEDVKTASHLFDLACRNNIAEGCLNLGNLYLNGKGVKKDPVKAFDLFEHACNLNFLPGCLLLGTMYENGIGVLPDMLLAEKYYTMSCNGGFIPACVDLGLFYSRKKEFSKALKLYKMTCDNNIALGCRNLAIAYRSGEGISRDMDKAIKLYKKACALGDKGSCNYIEIWASEPKLFDMPIGATTEKEFLYVAKQKHWKLKRESWIIANGIVNPEITGYTVSGINLRYLSKSTFWFIRVPPSSLDESILWKVNYKFDGNRSACSEYAKILKSKYGTPSEDYILNKTREITIWDFKYSMIVLSCPLRKNQFDLIYLNKEIRDYVNKKDESLLKVKSRSYEGL